MDFPHAAQCDTYLPQKASDSVCFLLYESQNYIDKILTRPAYVLLKTQVTLPDRKGQFSVGILTLIKEQYPEI